MKKYVMLVALLVLAAALCVSAQAEVYSGQVSPMDLLQKLTDLLDFLLPHYQEEGKHRLVVAVGCTGGAHRSVAIAEAIGAHLTGNGYHVDVNHRDLVLEQAHWKAGS